MQDKIRSMFFGKLPPSAFKTFMFHCKGEKFPDSGHVLPFEFFLLYLLIWTPLVRSAVAAKEPDPKQIWLQL